MNASADPSDSGPSQIDSLCAAFQEAQQAGQEPRIEDVLGEAAESMRSELLHRLLFLELEYRCRRGEELTIEFYADRFPQEHRVVTQVFHDYESNQDRTIDERDRPGLVVRCPNCHASVVIAVDGSFEDMSCSSCGTHFSLAVDQTEDASEVTTIGHFELIERLGIGGFGTVWKARDTQLDRTVAIKIPRKGQPRSDELQKFLREARSAAQLKHPNIVGVHEVGRDGDSVYIVSNLVSGVSLANWLSGKTMSFRESAKLCAKIADALEHAHENNVIHRDLKPQNIIIDEHGEPHITDFGLAKRETGEITMTVDGQVLGTPAYMPPEQATGGGHMADRRADIYSLGVILFQLISGELPFRGTRNMLIHQVVYDEPPSPRRFNSSIPRDLETICLKCLAKERSLRYPHAAELAADLRRFLDGEPIQARPVRPLTRAARWCKRNRAIAALLFAVFVSMSVGLLASSYFAWKTQIALFEAAQSEREKTEALTDALLGASRAIRRARSEGYRDEVYRLVRQALSLGPLTPQEISVLRHQAAGSMGDFVGLPPGDYGQFSSEIVSIAFHPEAKFFAVGLKDGKVRFLQPETGTVIAELTAHEHPVIGMEFGPTDQTLVTIDTSGRVLFHDCQKAGQPSSQRALQIGGGVASIDLGENCRYLAARAEKQVVIWDLTRGAEVATYIPQGLLMHNAVLSPDQQYLVISFEDEQTAEQGMLVWNVQDQREERRIPLSLGDAYANSVAFSPDGNLFAYGCDQALIVYEVPSFVPRSIRRTDANIAVAFSPDSQSLVSFDIRGRIALWSVTTGEKTAVLSHRRQRPSLQWLVFSADSTYLAAANGDSVRTWHLAGAVERLDCVGHPSSVPSIAYSPNGDRLASASKDRTVSFWDPSTRQRIATLPKFPGEVQCVAYSPDGKYLATAYWAPDNSIGIWDVETLRSIGTITHELDNINRLAFASNDLRLAAAGDMGVAVWKIDIQQSDEPHAVFEERLSKDGTKCRDITWSRDGRLVAWPNEQTRIQVWDFESEDDLDLSAPPMLQGWHGLAFVTDSDQLAYINFERGLQIWDVRQDQSFFAGEPAEFESPHIAFMSKGDLLAGLVGSDTVGVWDVKRREQLFALHPERTAIWSLAWSPNGSQLAVGLADGGLALWDLQRINRQLATLGLGVDPSPE